MTGDTRRRPTVQQWAGARELGEGEFSTYPRLAATLGVTTYAVQERAARERWKKLDFRKGAVMRAYRAAQSAMNDPDDAIENLGDAEIAGAGLHRQFELAEVLVGGTTEGDGDPLDRLSRLLSRQAGLILTSAEAQHGILNKAQLDALSLLIKLSEKLEAGAQGQVGQRQTRSDDEIAAVLERIDDRIVELAEEHAERLVAEKSDR